MKKQKIAFTFVELIVSTVIIVILSTIWFYSYVWYLSEARDWERMADLWVLQSALKVYKQKRWAYPLPWDYYNITNSWVVVALQWKMNKKVALSTLDTLPFDPLTETSYTYSVTSSRQESQIALTLENWDFPIALLNWDYHTVSYEVLPTIILAIEADPLDDIEIHNSITNVWWVWTDNRQKFVLDKWENLSYSTQFPFTPVYAYTGLDLWYDIIVVWKVDFWQNSDYINCIEIEEAWKYIHETWNEIYNIRSQDWALTNTWCILP